MKKFAAATAALFILMAAFCLAPVSAYAFSKGDKIPNFTLKDMQGKNVSLSDFKGKTVILNFWATWCPPCRGEMPEFNELHKELTKTGEAVLLEINLTDGSRDTKEKVAKFMAKNRYDMRVLLDTEYKASNLFSVSGIPTTVIIDGKGVLYEQYLGPKSKNNILLAIRGMKK